MISFLAFSVKRAWQGFWRNAAMSLAATATMTLMLILLAGFWALQAGVLAAIDLAEQKVQVVADLNDDATQVAINGLEGQLKAMPQVRSVEYISKDQALANFRASRQAQGQDDLTTYLANNPLPASLNVSLWHTEDYAPVADFLRADPDVQKVQNAADIATRLSSVSDFLRTGGVVLLGVVGAIVLFIIINTIRLAVLGRSEEIEVMRLVGASDAFIRWPFVFEGALVGLLGAILTLTVLGAAADPLSRLMVDFFQIVPLRVGTISRDVTLLVVGTGLGLGVLGAWVSVRTYLIR
jgi:cell division transport system permease protein